MAILFIVLKIIGIVLLVILSLILIVLFFPVRYKASIQLDELEDKTFDIEKIKKATQMECGISWLLHLIKILATLKEGIFSFGFFLLGIKVHKKKKKETCLDEAENTEDALAATEVKIEKKAKDKKKKKAKKDTPGKKEITSGVIGSIIVFWNMLQDENNKELMCLVLDELKYLCKHFGPRKMTGYLDFSTGRPDYTGLVVGVISWFPISYSKGLKLTPDFISEDFYAHGKIKISGHIRAVHFIPTGIHLLKNKTIRQLLKSRR